MKKHLMFGAIAASLLAVVFSAPVLATVAEDYLFIKKAQVNVYPDRNLLGANVLAHGLIPTDGSGGAFGYGIVTNDGDGILVLTTHAGVLDSEDQSFILDPKWHSHFVRLGAVEQCGDNLGVVDITWQSPGSVAVSRDKAFWFKVPTDEFSATHSITGTPFDVQLGEDVAAVVSFKLAPVFGPGGLEAVCVTDITLADDFNVNVWR
jgi:hypothetical protein